MFGSLGLGLALGLLIALLVELMNRRVRGPEDLQTLMDAPLLAVVSTPG
jgi:capsular polysaccharide biosynthesis protein